MNTCSICNSKCSHPFVCISCTNIACAKCFALDYRLKRSRSEYTGFECTGCLGVHRRVIELRESKIDTDDKWISMKM